MNFVETDSVCESAGDNQTMDGAAPHPLAPVLLVLHQPHSTPGHIGQWFARQGFPLDIRRPRFGDPLPHTLERHSGAVIFGGPMSANDNEDYIRCETDWIGVALAERKPFLGVCLGAQMLAKHLGCRVGEHPERVVEIGYHDVQPTDAGRRLGAWPDRVYQWHREGFELPAGAELIASSDGAFQNQAFTYGPAALGVQFHPEITHAMVHRWTGYNLHRLEQNGAQDRPGQINDHIVHGPRVRSWLDTVLRRWLAGNLTDSQPAVPVSEIATHP